VGLCGKYRVTSLGAGADPVGEFDEKACAQRGGEVARRQSLTHPLGGNRGEYVKVRRKRDDRRSLAGKAVVDLDLSVLRRELPLRRGAEHSQHVSCEGIELLVHAGPRSQEA
jgi:hypothetical protein